MTRVLLACDWFLRYASEQAIGLRADGAEVLVVCRDHLHEFANHQDEWMHLISHMRASGVEVFVVGGRAASLRAMRGGVLARRRINSWGPDIVHVHPNHDPWLLLATRSMPLVLTVHDPQLHPGQPRLGIVRRSIDSAWFSRADGFVVHGQRLRTLLEGRAGGRPIAVVPHGVNPAFAPDPVPSEPVILLLGRLEPYKGVGVLLEAMTHVWRARPEVVLVVAGRGPCAVEVPEHPKIRRMLRYVTDDEVDRLLRDATLVAAPYTQASQSGVVSLAVARGIPAVVTDERALPDLAADRSLVVPAGDATALARSLIGKLDHGPELRSRVYEMACERLSWTVAGRLTIAFYRELLGR